MSIAEYFKYRSARSQLKGAIRQANAIRNMQRDVAGEVNDRALCDVIASARQTYRNGRTSGDMQKALEGLSAAVGPGTAWKPLHPNALAENFEVLVVAICVAFAFRCYFLEPFKIPTGSMQPTLYGIYSTDQAEPGFWDRHPFKVFKWIVTGDWYKDIHVMPGGSVQKVRATVKPGYESFEVAGKLYHVPTDAVTDVQAMIKPGFDTYEIAGKRYHVPAAAVTVSVPIAGKVYHVPVDAMTEVLVNVKPRPDQFAIEIAGRRYHVSADAMTVELPSSVAPGVKLWSGVVHAGDHVFVNRILWNFRKPRRGEVMVFNTGGIKGLPQGTHYIKRMVGLPGETIGISQPELIVDGKPVSEPYTIGRIVRREAAPHPEAGYPNYLGYQPIGAVPPSAVPSRSPLCTDTNTITLAAGEYLGMGDNTGNSYDGRYWGAVPAKKLLGPGAFVYWPFTSKRFGIIH